MRTIAIDAMGGENAPDAIVKAVLQAKTGMPETKFLLFGDKEALRKLIPEDQINDQLGVVPTTEVIADEDEPVKAIRKKKDSTNNKNSASKQCTSIAQGKQCISFSFFNEVSCYNKCSQKFTN